MLFEVCCDTVESAVNAARGGAKRIELCSALKQGGLTPSIGVIDKVCSLLKSDGLDVQVFVMIRPRPGDFIYSEHEVSSMELDIALAAKHGANGAVFGALTTSGEVDERVTGRLASTCREHDLDMTFHRALDLCVDLNKSVRTVQRLGISRVLTAGGTASVSLGADQIKELSKNHEGMTVMAGGGVNCLNALDIARRTGCNELHGSLKRDQETAMKKLEYREHTSMHRDEVREEFASWWVADYDQVVKMTNQLRCL